jgi:hypothetical protein
MTLVSQSAASLEWFEMKPKYMPSEATILRLMNTEIKRTPDGTPHYNTLNHWNNEEWFSSITNVSGTGKYRFNQLGTDGFAWRQTRCKSKDEAIEMLCTSPHRLVQVKEGDGQYEVRTYYMEGY